MKILVVEDSELLQNGYARMLRGKHDFQIASDPREARRMVNEGFEPDVILSDWNMPVMNGGEFCELLRESGNNVPFIIISAEDRSEAVARIGASEALLKPISPSVILLTIDKWGPKSGDKNTSSLDE